MTSFSTTQKFKVKSSQLLDDRRIVVMLLVSWGWYFGWPYPQSCLQVLHVGGCKKAMALEYGAALLAPLISDVIGYPSSIYLARRGSHSGPWAPGSMLGSLCLSWCAMQVCQC